MTAPRLPAAPRACATCGAPQPMDGRARIREGKIACYVCVPEAADTRRRDRRVTPRALIVATNRLTRALLESHASLLDDEVHAAADRPKTWGECAGMTGPCPWVSCKHHLYLDVTDAGSLKLNFPDHEPDELEHPCALRLASAGGLTLEEVGQRINVTRERLRQIEGIALRKFRREAGEL